MWAVPKTTRAGIAAWRICRYLTWTQSVRPGHANKAVEAGVHASFVHSSIMDQSHSLQRRRCGVSHVTSYRNHVVCTNGDYRALSLTTRLQVAAPPVVSVGHNIRCLQDVELCMSTTTGRLITSTALSPSDI